MSAELCEAERGCTTCYKWASKCGPSGFWPGINNARKLTDASPVLAAPSPSRVTAARASGISPAWTRRSLRSPRSATRGPVRRAPRRTTRRSRTTWRPVSLLSRKSIQSWRKERPKGRRRRRSTRGRGRRVRQSPHSLGVFAEPTHSHRGASTTDQRMAVPLLRDAHGSVQRSRFVLVFRRYRSHQRLTLFLRPQTLTILSTPELRQ